MVFSFYQFYPELSAVFTTEFSHTAVRVHPSTHFTLSLLDESEICWEGDIEAAWASFELNFCLVRIFRYPLCSVSLLTVPTSTSHLSFYSGPFLVLFRSVTWAFSSNVNPNRFPTEGYCSSSQKRRQIFRYWGAADPLVCCHAHFFLKWFGDDIGDVWWLLSLLGVTGW